MLYLALTQATRAVGGRMETFAEFEAALAADHQQLRVVYPGARCLSQVVCIDEEVLVRSIPFAVAKARAAIGAFVGRLHAV